jgi:RNA polymerase sigma factor (TIGR02999 family)
MKTGSNITRLIEAHRNGDGDAYDRAVELLYSDLHGLAHRQLARFHGQATLHTTAVVNEAYIRLRDSSGEAVDRAHFLGIAAKAMRHVVIDYARKRSAEKRGGNLVQVELQDSDAAVAAQAEQLLLIDQSLRELANTSERLVRVFECKFFAGLNDDETAKTLGLAKRTAQRDWMKARALLADLLSRQD